MKWRTEAPAPPIAAIRADLARSYELAIEFKPSGVKT